MWQHAGLFYSIRELYIMKAYGSDKDSLLQLPAALGD
jgi:hypothetical protein